MNVPETETTVSAKELYKQIRAKRAFGRTVDENITLDLERNLPDKLTLKSPDFPFRLFSRQQLALEAVDSFCCVFSNEISEKGARQYFTAKPIEFWRKCIIPQSTSKQQQLHFYEVILPDRPVRLYIDLDLKTPPETFTLSDLKIAEIVRSLVFHFLCLMLNKNDCFSFSKPFTIDSLRLVVQSASDRPRKISLHFVWPDVWFDCNKNAGEFVKTIKEELESRIHCQKIDHLPKCQCVFPENLLENCQNRSFELASSCLLSGKDFLIDLGVYDRNRNWRLWRSCKRAGGPRLKLLKLFGYSKSSLASITEENIFVESIVCPPPVLSPNEKMIFYKKNQQVNLNSHSLSSLSFFYPPSSASSSSPFPDIDAFLCNEILAKRLPQTTTFNLNSTSQLIRWSRHLPSSLTIVYDISNRYRFCGRINRHHRSNRVFFVVSLISGEITQRCHDPDCASFRSFPPWLLPRHLLHQTQ